MELGYPHDHMDPCFNLHTCHTILSCSSVVGTDQVRKKLVLLGYGDLYSHTNERITSIRGKSFLSTPLNFARDARNGSCNDARIDGVYDDDVDDDEAFSAPNLSSSIWSSLPSELVERIFACLPMASLFKFRAVCRSWNIAPFEPVFRSLRALTMVPEAWLLMLAATPANADGKKKNPTWKTNPNHKGSPKFSNNWSFVFNLEDDKLVALPDTFLPFPPYPGRFSYCTDAGGLICYHHHSGFHGLLDRNRVSLWVGNPFTREWKCLPPMIGSFPLNFPLRGLAGMVVLNDSADRRNHNSSPLKLLVHYKIIVRTTPRNTWGSTMMTEEYDSVTNQWRVTTTWNVPLDHRIEQVVHCNGSLYFLTWQMRDGIYAYHVEKQEWMQILPPQALYDGHSMFTSPHIVECSGQLVLVSGVGRHHTTRVRGSRRKYHMRTTGIELWRRVEEFSAAASLSTTGVQPSSGPVTGRHGSSCTYWSSLGSMPDELVHEFVVGSVQFHCASIRNQIYLTNNVNMLIFDVELRLWRRVIVTQLPFVVEDFVSFMPKLEASP